MDDAQDREHWRLADEVSARRWLVGHTRVEVRAWLGDGVPCTGRVKAIAGTNPPAVRQTGPMCPDGYESEDWRYDIGRLRKGWDGGTPVLFVDFDATGHCTRTTVLHEQ